MSFCIKRVIAKGDGQVPSAIEFSSGVNLIHGPSQTGKTAIYKAILFAFGSDQLPFVKETGYDTIIVEIETDDGNVVSFNRSLDSKSVYVSSNSERIPSGEYTTGNSKKLPPINDVLLSLLHIEPDRQVIKNENFDKQKFTFNTIRRAFMVNEDDIDRSKPSILIPQSTGITAFLSSLLVLLQDEKLNQLESLESSEARKIRHRAIREFISSQQSQLKEKLSKIQSEYSDLFKENVETYLSEIEKQAKEIHQRLTTAIKQDKELASSIQKKEDELFTLRTFSEQRSALLTQLRSDQERLRFNQLAPDIPVDLEEDDLLCPTCSQHIPDELLELHRPVCHAERKRTEALIHEIETALTTLQSQIGALEEHCLNEKNERALLQKQINGILQPSYQKLQEVLRSYKVSVRLEEQLKALNDQDNQLTTALVNLENEPARSNLFKPRELFDQRFVPEMQSFLRNLLVETGFVESEKDVHFSLQSFDISINGYPEKGSNNSKGYCAFLNTAVVLALRDYMARYASTTPGFTVIDSPLHGMDEGEQEHTDASKIRALFAFMAETGKQGQLIIIENTKNTPDLDYQSLGVKVTAFTKNKNTGRYGFLLNVDDETAKHSEKENNQK